MPTRNRLVLLSLVAAFVSGAGCIDLLAANAGGMIDEESDRQREIKLASKHSKRALIPEVDWRCIPDDENPRHLACHFVAVQNGLLCGDITVHCPDGPHRASEVCAGWMTTGHTRDFRVTAFAPELSGTVNDCTRITFSAYSRGRLDDLHALQKRRTEEQRRAQRQQATPAARKANCDQALHDLRERKRLAEREALFLQMTEECRKNVCETLVPEWRAEKDLGKRTLLYEGLPETCRRPITKKR